MDSKSFAAAAYRAEQPAAINRRSRRGFVSQAVRADNPRARDPQAYPYSKPRPEKATRPVLSFEWTDLRKPVKAAEPVAPVVIAPVMMDPAALSRPVEAVEAPAVEPKRLMPSQRAHLLRPLALRGSDGRQTYVTYTFDKPGS